MYKRQFLPIALFAALAVSLTACSKNDPPPAPVVAGVTTSSYDTVASTGKGFTVGALMSAQAVYVLFDPQCPHCGHLWQASLPLHNKVKFVWIPVAFNAGKSLSLIHIWDMQDIEFTIQEGKLWICLLYTSRCV